MIPQDLTHFKALVAVGGTSWFIALALIACGLASLTALFERLILRRCWVLRHTIWTGLVAPLVISLLGVAFLLDRFWLWAKDPIEPEIGIRLIAAARMLIALGGIDCILGATVHFLNPRPTRHPHNIRNESNA